MIIISHNLKLRQFFCLWFCLSLVCVCVCLFIFKGSMTSSLKVYDERSRKAAIGKFIFVLNKCWISNPVTIFFMAQMIVITIFAIIEQPILLWDGHICRVNQSKVFDALHLRCTVQMVYSCVLCTQINLWHDVLITMNISFSHQASTTCGLHSILNVVIEAVKQSLEHLLYPRAMCDTSSKWPTGQW